MKVLSKSVAQEHREPWDRHLAELVCSYNTVVQGPTHCSTFEVMDVPIQSGTYVWRQLNALAQGEKPEHFFIFFDQWNVQEHLWQCFDDGEMKMFPVLRKWREKKSAVKTTKEVPVYLSADA